MTTTQSSAATVVAEFFTAFGTGDLATARQLLRDDLAFKGPLDTFTNADDYIAAIGKLAPLVKGVEQRKVFVDDPDVAVFYDMLTPMGTAPVTEWHRVENGKIASIQVYFDARPFAAAMAPTSARDRHTGTLPVLPVPDVTAAIDWYVTTLGFEKLFDVPTDQGVVVTGQVARDGNNIMFNLNPKDAGGAGGGIWIWCRVESVDDLDGWYADLTGRNVGSVQPPETQYWGDRYFAIRDLNGYVLAFNRTSPEKSSARV